MCVCVRELLLMCVYVCAESPSRQATVQQMQDTVLSTPFERLAVGYNTLGMKHLKDGRTIPFVTAQSPSNGNRIEQLSACKFYLAMM